MAPLDLQPHSCSYCQNNVVDLSGMRRRSDDNLAKKGVLFSCTYSDIIDGAEHGCQFYSWLLENEVVSRETILLRSPNDLPPTDPYWKVLDALQDSAIFIKEFLGEALPQNTLRHIDPQKSDHLQDHRLFAATYQSTGDRLDLDRIEFFGLWNPETTKIDYRTRHGFSVFTESDDPAARTVTTRPIEKDPAADQSISQISSWLLRCQNEHALCQTSSTKLPGRLLKIVVGGCQRSLQLLDTKNLGPVRYVALSYCWGGEQSVACTNCTISQFQTEILVSNLPSTIQDAVTVCHKLSITYLWVDSLCIIQDDQHDKITEISKMPYIYGNASFTIAAASPRTVEDGFLNQRAAASPTTAFTLPFRCHDNVLGSVTIFRLDITPEPLDERGWTFQERLLSKRVIEFGSRSTRWHCHESNYTERCSDGWMAKPECSPLEKSTLDIVNFQRIKDFHPARDYGHIINHWEHVVKAYTQRKISLLTDRSQAISGIAEVFGQLFHEQYRAGLWTSSMHAGLLWQISEETRMPRPTIYQGPSWSWIGVNGTVDFGHFKVTDWRVGLCQAQILDIDCAPVSDQAPYGAIKQTSGLLKLRARMARGVRVASDERNRNTDEDKFTVGFWGRNGAGLCLAMAKMSSDAIEEDFSNAEEDDEDNEEGNAIQVLEIKSNIKGGSWQCRGLVLRAIPAKQNWFRRVGTFHHETHRDGRKEGESNEDWETRVALEFDWFRHQPYSTVTIV